MAKKIFGLGTLVAILAFGMAVTGCGNDDTNVSPLDGRWVYYDDPSQVWVFSSGILRMYEEGSLVENIPFSTSGNNITLTMEGIPILGTFTVAGSILTITFMGETAVLRR